MPSAKSVFGVIGALLPVVYCVSLLAYFLDTSGSVKNAEDIGLGPTLLGLGVLGLLFCIPLLWRIVRMFSGPRPPGPGEPGNPGLPKSDGAAGFDADAVIARYMARRSTDSGPGSLPDTPGGSGNRRSDRPSFGRRTR